MSETGHFVRDDVRAFLDALKANPRPRITAENVAALRPLASQGFALLEPPIGELSAMRDLAAPGLAGEIRPVTGVPRRLAEAARLGFRTAIVPRDALGSAVVPQGIRVVEVADLRSALASSMPGRP